MKYRPTKARWSKQWRRERAELVALANRMNLADTCSGACKRRGQCSPSLSWVDRFHWDDNQLFSMTVAAHPPCLALLLYGAGDGLDDRMLEVQGYEKKLYRVQRSD